MTRVHLVRALSGAAALASNWTARPVPGRAFSRAVRSWLYAIPEDSADDPVQVVRDGVRISGNCAPSAAASVRLGRDVLLACDVDVSDRSHADEVIARPACTQGAANVRPIPTGVGARLAQLMVVCPGLTGGTDAFAPAGGLVLDQVLSHTGAAGAPVRGVRMFQPREPASVPA